MNEMITLLGLLTVSVFFIWLHYYKKYQLDSYRQSIFQIRDDLFDYAAEGNISFDHPAYGMTRTYLNGSIRFAERLSLLRMVIMRAEFGKHESHFEQAFEEKVEGLNQEQRRFVNMTIDSAIHRTIVHIVRKNVIIVFLFRIVRLFEALKYALKLANDKLTIEYKIVYSDAVYNEGKASSSPLNILLPSSTS